MRALNVGSRIEKARKTGYRDIRRSAQRTNILEVVKMTKNNRTSHLTVDENTLLAEYRRSGLTPEDIKTLKRQTDEKYIHVLAYRYWIACAKLHNANELLHGNCRCCIHWNALEQEKMPCLSCYYLVGADAQIDGWECVRDISEEANGLLEKYDVYRRRAVEQQ